jgi:hypothetical protein
MEVPNRMECQTFPLNIDNVFYRVTLNYVSTETGIRLVAIWVRTKKSESTLDREVRIDGKAVSLLLQFGCTLKEMVETFTRDSVIGSVVWYIQKNLEDILNGNQLEKLPSLSTQPAGYTIK